MGEAVTVPCQADTHPAVPPQGSLAMLWNYTTNNGSDNFMIMSFIIIHSYYTVFKRIKILFHFEYAKVFVRIQFSSIKNWRHN
jgi:hypothetical protein